MRKKEYFIIGVAKAPKYLERSIIDIYRFEIPLAIIKRGLEKAPKHEISYYDYNKLLSKKEGELLDQYSKSMVTYIFCSVNNLRPQRQGDIQEFDILLQNSRLPNDHIWDLSNVSEYLARLTINSTEHRKFKRWLEGYFIGAYENGEAEGEKFALEYYRLFSSLKALPYLAISNNEAVIHIDIDTDVGIEDIKHQWPAITFLQDLIDVKKYRLKPNADIHLQASALFNEGSLKDIDRVDKLYGEFDLEGDIAIVDKRRLNRLRTHRKRLKNKKIR